MNSKNSAGSAKTTTMAEALLKWRTNVRDRFDAGIPDHQLRCDHLQQCCNETK